MRLDIFRLQSKETYRELFKVGFPIILGQVGIILVSFADNIMVGRYSTDHLASASLVNNLLALVYVIGIGFAYGLTPLVATAFEQGKYFKAGALMRHSLVLNVLLAVVLSVLMLALYLNIEIFDMPERLLPIIRPYYLLVWISFLLMMGFNAFKQFFDGMGNTSLGMWVILASNALNILGNWILIYGKFGFPELGLYGAGLSTFVSRAFILVVFLVYFASSKRYARAWQGVVSCRVWCQKSFSRLVRLGAPVGMYSGVETAAFTIALIFVTRLGHIALAVHQILCVVTTLGFFVYYGWGAATTILISRHRTQGDYQGVRESVSAGLQYSLIASFVAMAIMLVFREQIGYIFSEDEALAPIVAGALLPVIFYQFGDAMQVLYANALRGMQSVNYLAIYSSLVHLVLEPAMAFVFGFYLVRDNPDLQLIAIWSAFPVGLLLLGVLLRREFNRVLERAEQEA